MDLEVDVRSIWSGYAYHNDSMWQPELYKDDKESNVPCQIEAYRNSIFLYKGYSTKGRYKYPVCEYRWASCWCADQASISSKVLVFPWQYRCSLKILSS